MTINNIILLTIVSSFIAYGHTAPGILDDEFTLAQLKGEWLDIGRISTCNDIPFHRCITHTIETSLYGDSYFILNSRPYENIPKCDRGVPIHSWAVIGNFDNAKIFSGESLYYSALNATIKSHNNGEELILTEAQRESCSGTSYRLWSREREVSAETKAEFEKLVGNRIVEYSPWDHCPIVRSEIHEAPIDLVYDGLWYDIARIAVEGDDDTCCLHNMTVNHAYNTFNIVDNLIRNGNPVVEEERGYLTKFGTVSRFGSDDEGYFNFYEISCNKGEHRITVGDDTTSIHLVSRNQRVPAETLAEFRRMADTMKEMAPNLVYTSYSYDDCPK